MANPRGGEYMSCILQNTERSLPLSILWFLFLVFSLALFVSTEEFSKTFLKRRKQFFSILSQARLTQNILHACYIGMSARDSGLKGENDFVSPQFVMRCFTKHSMQAEPLRGRTPYSFPSFHLALDSKRHWRGPVIEHLQRGRMSMF